MTTQNTNVKQTGKRNQTRAVATTVDETLPIPDMVGNNVEDNAAGGNAGGDETILRDSSPIVLPLTTSALSIGDFFKTVRISDVTATINIGGALVEFPPDMLNSLFELGLRRTLDTNAATEGHRANSATMPAFIVSHIQRLQRGYMSLSEEKKAQAKALAGGGNASVKGIGTFGRTQILGKMSDLAENETQLAALEVLKTFSDEKWQAYLKAAIIKPESLACMAIAELNRLLKLEAEQAMKAAESEFGELLI